MILNPYMKQMIFLEIYKKMKILLQIYQVLYFKLGTKYDLLKIVSNQFYWKILENKPKDDNKFSWNIKWFDYYINEEDIRKM